MADLNKGQQQVAKVLRIGVVQGRKVIHEQLIKPGEGVTVGESPKNTVVFEHPGLPKRLALFENKGGKYFLSFNSAMSGMVAADGDAMSLDDLRTRPGATEKAGVWRVPIESGYRGKITVGDITVLFQFVAAPPEPAKQVSSKDFRPKLFDQDDHAFVGFLTFFSALAIVMSIYAATTEPPEIKSLDDIPDRFVKLVLPDKKEVEIEEPPPVDEDAPKIEKEDGEVKKDQSKDQKPLPKARNKDEQRQNDALNEERARQSAQSRSAVLAMLGTTGVNNNGGAVEDVFSDSSAKLGSVADMLASGASSATAATSKDIGMRNGTGTGRGEDGSVGGIGEAGSGGPDAQVAKAAATPARKSSAKLGSISSSPENGDLISSAVKKYSSGVKSCYDLSLKANPNLAGKITVDVDINGGRVTTVSLSNNTTNDAAFGDCVVKKVRTWRFDPSVSDSIALPFTFSAS